ncbi:helix-turn-helix domain-containing protein [Actinomyces marmotae]|uniref:Helix-turn-helix domain-containing protein n=1 Tax=Actinomyces marmotae TaxID=2737173 RepID=A0A6M8B662_9ACTO|nr:helix-turn-helix domain-containing protein [Actinomyces marmotae]QKD80147.1 helix-turn-helix domain-containing protein [Actinomyces marmotae]
MTDYTSVVYLVPHPAGTDDDDIADRLIDALALYHPAVGQEPWDPSVWTATISLPAENLPQAITTSLAVVSALGHVRGIDALPTTDFDARHHVNLEDELDSVEFVSVAQAAQRLGITPQGVRHRISAGVLPAHRVGHTWNIPATALPTARGHR